MKKHLRLFFSGIVCVLMALMMVFSACSKSNDETSSSSSSGPEVSSGTSEDSSSGSSSASDSSQDDSSSDGNKDNTGDQTDNTETVTTTVTAVKLSSSSLNLNSGDSKTLSLTITTSDGSEYTSATWQSSNEEVITVSGSGTSATIYAVASGSATITATAGGKTATCSVTVVTSVIENLTAAKAYSESMYATWAASNVENTTAYYKLSSEQDTDNNWIQVDSNLIRIADGAGRVDIVGLAAGIYDIKVSVNGTVGTATNIAVSEYDRSGYAHFNTDGYDEGVGAYTDEGTLKDGALVIYLTESNKNDVTDYCYTYSASTGTYTKVDPTTFKSNYLTCSSDTTYGSGHVAVGIGEILNNRRYSGNDRHEVGIAKLCDVYGAVAIRVIGTVEAELSNDGLTATITGLTDYDATTNGGSEGDNGRMARMTNAHDLTIEGIGTDATIQGWGFHFIASDTLDQYQTYGSGAGKSFEVRNIAFTEYPEDAIGMEGVQGTQIDATGSVTSGASSANADLLSPVEYCWIHNNSFLPGYCANPAESDKKEGDGSCDFKRGQYYTLSYNYFEYCHKTNLIGSSDTSLQYNISMHHNYWYNCGSRIPLARRANIHFYNNYIYGNTNDSNADLSYVSSVRANCYLYAENNYYEGCKSVIQQKDGVEKSYGNSYYQCFTDTLPTQVATRTTSVANSCAFIYYNIDYSSFDTDSTLFYYDSEANTSNCYLTSAVVARAEAINGAGVNDDDPAADTSMNLVTPSSSLSIDETNGLTVDLTQVSKGSSTVSGVEFTNITGVSSGTIKGKGQLVTFTLASETQLTIAATGSSYYYYGELIGSDGTVYASKFTDLTIILKAGTYVIASGTADKELTISSLSFENTAASSAARVTAATEAINALSGYTTLEQVSANLTTFEGLVTTAQSAYSALTTSELETFDTALKTTLNTAVSLLNEAKADVVEAYIADIGTVTQDSYDKINAARTAYNSLTADQKALVTNYATLTAAEAAYEQFAVDNVIAIIEALPALSEIDISDRNELEDAITAYEEAQAAYEALDNGETGKEDDNTTNKNPMDDVTNASKLSDLAELEEMHVIYDFIDLLDEMDKDSVSLSDSANVTTLTTYYNALTNADGTYYSQFNTMLTGDYASYVTKYQNIVEAYNALASQTIIADFLSTTESELGNGVTINGIYFKGSLTTTSATIQDGTTYSQGMKIESKTVITIAASTTKRTVTLYFNSVSSHTLSINGTTYNIGSDYTLTFTAEANTEYSIAKKDGTKAILYKVLLAPAT
ncbi:MAG: Ig-like domain-containing protein [Clostridia bacterium]|nr:Ig-like domain-containing protein [Clostridia bacterium]